MAPTLRDRAVVVVLGKWFVKEFERFDVITLRAPFSDELQTKRIVGFPGETIRISGGMLFINNEPVLAPHRTTNAGNAEQASFTIPARHVFVLGDNRMPLASRDSRQYGPVPLENITGKLLGY